MKVKDLIGMLKKEYNLDDTIAVSLWDKEDIIKSCERFNTKQLNDNEIEDTLIMINADLEDNIEYFIDVIDSNVKQTIEDRE